MKIMLSKTFFTKTKIFLLEWSLMHEPAKVCQSRTIFRDHFREILGALKYSSHIFKFENRTLHIFSSQSRTLHKTCHVKTAPLTKFFVFKIDRLRNLSNLKLKLSQISSFKKFQGSIWENFRCFKVSFTYFLFLKQGPLHFFFISKQDFSRKSLFLK